jgi:hypothetical protein
MSDAVSAEALVALETAVAALLPAAVPQGLTRQLRIRAQSVRPLGMGGYVGLHRAPDAALYGRRIAARVDVGVAGGNDATAQGYAAALCGQVLSASRAETAQRGIHRIRGAEATDARSAAFDVDFEYVPVPATGEGVIETLALETLSNVTPYRTRMVADFAGASLAVAAAPLADFAPFTDAEATPAGAWSVSAAAPAAIVQTAASRGGPLDLADAQKAGTMLLWRPRGIALDLPRFVLSVVFASTSPDGVGVVFHRRSADDYAFFLASQRHGYHLFGRRRPGGWEALASSAFGFAATGASQRLVVLAYDGQLVAELDGRRTLVAAAAPAAGGEVGLLTHGNAVARFTAGRLMGLVA